ncbi:MAG TPA: hypothetical protein VK929_16875 [Longimicrobiales bacterium]|nr:hypothetical protein [Longimicrobiales bacterium]
MAAQHARIITAALLLAGLTALMPSRADAQLNLQVVPKIGVFTPLAPFGETSELQSTLALGLAAELLLPSWPVNLRANLEHATTTDIVRRDASETVLGTARITTVVGDVVLRPFAAPATFQPYLLAGGGVKIHEIDREVGTLDLSGLAERFTRGTLHVGGGVDARFGPLAVLLEVGNYMSTVEAVSGESRVQHDAFGMLGFRVSMF